LLNVPQWIALVEAEAGVDNHRNPEGYKDEEKQQIPALPVVAYDPAVHLRISVRPSRRKPPYYRPQRSPHASAASLHLLHWLAVLLGLLSTMEYEKRESLRDYRK
jgi:hypothetical protein